MDSGQQGNPQLIKVQRESVKRLAIERTHVSYLTPLPLRLGDHEGREDRKYFKKSSSEMIRLKSCFLNVIGPLHS